MANVAHATLTGSNLHEPKGAAAAAVDEIYQADGAGSGDWKLPIKKYSITISPAEVAVNTTAEEAFTCTGLLVASDTIIGVSKPTAQAGLGIVGWRCSDDDEISITFANVTAGALTPTASEEYTVFAHRA